MSFGASPSDLSTIVSFCRTLYRRCRDAGGEYDEVSREVRGLHTVLRHLKSEVTAEDSVLYDDHSAWDRELAPIMKDCDYTLQELNGLIEKYGRLAGDEKSPSSTRGTWEKTKLGSNEMDDLGSIRVKLISLKMNLTTFLDALQFRESKNIAAALENQGEQLDVILDKVDKIAARMYEKSGSFMTTYEDDDKEVWKQFRRELVAEGFSSDVLQEHKDVLRAYIREVEQNGLLDVDHGPKTPSPIRGLDMERWIDTVPDAGVPRSTAPLNTTIGDDSNETAFKDDKLRLRPAIKLDRPIPASRVDYSDRTPISPTSVDHWKDRNSSITKSITSGEGIRDINLNRDSHERGEITIRPPSPTNSVIIRTQDLLSSSQALQLSSSPSSFRSYSSYTEEPTVQRQKQTDFPSNIASGAIPIPSIREPSRTDRFSTSPRYDSGRLAPDSQGNDIPVNAKWTKINRKLVSPEVLSQDNRRYEARPDFVAVLGVLTREEIKDYATRSQILREARQHVKQPEISAASQTMRASQHGTKHTRSRDVHTSESDSHSESEHYPHTRRRQTDRKSYPASASSYLSDRLYQSGYPNPYGVPPAPSSTASTASITQANEDSYKSSNSRASTYPTSARDKERDDSQRYRRHSSPGRRSSSYSRADKDKSRDRDFREKEKEKSKSRWRDNLAAAGIGGAAASLLSVLSEAAEAL